MKNKKFNVGINDADYVLSKYETLGKYPNGNIKQRLIWRCPYYTRWCDMLKRCYAKGNKSYKNKGCVVCDEWLTFSNFKAWMETQDWEGKELDKDVLGDGKLYSPQTCIFIDKRINLVFTDNQHLATANRLPKGVHWSKKDRCYKIQWVNPFTGKTTGYKTFKCAKEAGKIWLKIKATHYIQLSYSVNDSRIRAALHKKYNETLDAYEQLENVKEVDCYIEE